MISPRRKQKRSKRKRLSVSARMRSFSLMEMFFPRFTRFRNVSVHTNKIGTTTNAKTIKMTNKVCIFIPFRTLSLTFFLKFLHRTRTVFHAVCAVKILSRATAFLRVSSSNARRFRAVYLRRILPHAVQRLSCVFHHPPRNGFSFLFLPFFLTHYTHSFPKSQALGSAKIAFPILASPPFSLSFPIGIRAYINPPEKGKLIQIVQTRPQDALSPHGGGADAPFFS